MVTQIKVQDIFEIAWDEDINNIPAWIVISTVNEMLKKANINAIFEHEQQNMICYNEKGEGTLFRLVANKNNM